MPKYICTRRANKKRHRTKTRRQTGGDPKFIGKGSFGCTYIPPFECVPLPPIDEYATPEQFSAYTNEQQYRTDPSKIAKLMNTDEAQHEMSIASVFKRIDPAQEYFLYPKYSCQVNPRAVKTANGANYLPSIHQCIGGPKKNPLRKLPEQAVQIFMKYGGNNLSNLDLALQANANSVLESMLRLFDGLTLLHSKNIVHLDIKPDNIVFNTDDGYAPYIIDFGLICSPTKIYLTNLNWFRIYNSYPPEVSFLSKKLISPNARTERFAPLQQSANKPPIEIETPQRDIIAYITDVFLKENFFEHTKELLVAGVPDRVFKNPDGTSKVDATYTSYMNDTINFLFIEDNTTEASQDIRVWLDIDYDDLRLWLNQYNEGRSEKDSTPDIKANPNATAFFAKFVRAIDAYSLGYVLTYVWHRLVGFSTYMSSDGPPVITAKLPNGRWVGSSDKIILDFWHEVVIPFEQIIEDLMNIKFTKRLTITEVSRKYEVLIPILNMWYENKKFRRVLQQLGRQV